MNRGPLLVLFLVIALVAAGAGWLVFNNAPADTASDRPNAGAGAVDPVGSVKNSPESLSNTELATAKSGASDGGSRTEAPGKSAAGETGSNQAGEAVIVGRVTTADGRVAVAGAKIYQSSYRSFDFFPSNRNSAPASAVTNERGEFTIKGVDTTDRLRLRVEAPGRVRQSTEVGTLKEGERRDVGEISLATAAQIEGRVTDSVGGPIAGAVVSAAKAATSTEISFSFREPLWLDVETDANGRYMLDGIVPGTQVVLHARQPGRLPAKSEPIEAKLGTARVAPDLVLNEGKEITGRVLDRAGAPVAGAVVQHNARGGFGDFYFEGRFEPNRTNAEGFFRIAGLDDRSANIYVTAVGKGSAQKRNVTPGTRDLILQIEDLATISGRLVPGPGMDAATFAQALATVEVEARNVWTGNAMMPMKVPEKFEGSGRVREDGAFRLTGIEKGKYKVEVTGASIAPALSQLIEANPERPVENIEIPIVSGHRLSVRVTKAGDKDPMEGARVRLKELRERKDGMDFFPSDDMDVTPPQPAPGSGRRVRSASRTIEARSASVAVGGPLPSGSTVGVGPGGAPKIRMPLSENDPNPEPVDITLETNEKGAVEFKGLPTANFRVTVTSDEAAPSKPVEVNLANALVSKPESIEVALSEGGTVSGTVLRPDASPASGVRVEFYGPEPLVKRHDATVDGVGRYELTHLAAGVYHAKLGKKEQFDGPVRVSMTSDAPIEGVAVSVVDGKVSKLDLEAPQQVTLTGVVTQAGTPVSGVRVTLAPAEEDVPDMPEMFVGMPGEHSATTDGSGRYKIENIDSGSYNITAKKPSAVKPSTIKRDLRDARESCDISLPRGVIEGRITKVEGGEPLAGATVKLIEAGEGGGGAERAVMAFAMVSESSSGGATEVMTFDGRGSVKTDSQGRFKIEDVPPGKYKVRASAANLRDATSEAVSMGLDERIADVDLKLDKAASITGRVLGENGAPRANSIVSIRKKGGEKGTAPKLTVSGEDGRYRFTSLEPGEYYLGASGMNDGTIGGSKESQVTVLLEGGIEATKDVVVK